MCLRNDHTGAVKYYKVSIVRFAIPNKFLEFWFVLQDGDKVIAALLGNTFFHSGDRHAPDESWNIFQYRKLIQLEVRLCSEIGQEFGCPCAGRGLGSLSESEDQDGHFACGGLGQCNLLARKAFPSIFGICGTTCAIEGTRKIRKTIMRTNTGEGARMKISPIR